jgi:urate oxidase
LQLEIDTREYIDNKVEESDIKTELKIAALTQAFNKAEGTLAIRLDSMNEFRLQLADQASHFITRKEFQLAVDGNNKDLSAKVSALQYLVLALLLAFLGAFIGKIL